MQALIAASPSSVPLEDEDGMSALEHAIFSDAPIRVVKLLQHVTRKQCEARQRQQEREQGQGQQQSSMVTEEYYSAPLLSRRVSMENPPQQESGVEDMVISVPTMDEPSPMKGISSDAFLIPAMNADFGGRRRRPSMRAGPSMRPSAA